MRIALTEKFPRRTVSLVAGRTSLIDDRVVLALEEYAAAQDAHSPISRESLLAKYADVADEVIGCLDSLDFIRHVAPQLNDNAEADSGNSSAVRPLAALGDFRIVREIGRGGMGVVYEAEQLSLGRPVALKVLPFAAMLDKQQLARFKNEARAAATLDHPNIVAIYSVGVERGVHYYAMQLIDGQSLAQMIGVMRQKQESGVRGQESGVRGQESGADDQKSPAHPLTPSPAHSSTPSPAHTPAAETVPRAALSTIPAYDTRDYCRTIAELGIQAAEALDHAHQNGIIHRDVKPANMLIDETGKLWVTDFGLARLEADAGMTMTGDIVGTLRYMSPEQALAKRVVIDHRTDIYSLGITLYELLTLRPVFEGDDRQQLLHQIAFDEPPPPRKLNRQIPPELETIVLKAIRKNPAERYLNARDLADDLRNYIANRPINAKPPTARERLVKWSQRHPAGVRASMLALSVIAIAVAASGGWIVRDRATRQAALELQITQALEDAKTWHQSDKLTEAMSAVKRAGGLLASGGCSDELKNRIDQWRADLEIVGRLEQIRLDEAAPATMIILPRLGGPEKAASPSELLSLPVDTVWNRPAADRAYRREFQRYGIDIDALDVEGPSRRIRNSSIKQELIAALDDWFQVTQFIDSRRNEKSPGKKELLHIARLADPDPWRNRLRDAVERDNGDALTTLAADQDVLAQPPSTVMLLARALDNRKLFSPEVQLMEAVQRRHPADFWINTQLAFCLENIKPARLDEAIGFRRAAVALRPDSPGAYLRLGATLVQCGKYPPGEAALREAIRLKPDFATASYDLGTTLYEQGRYPEAEATLRETIRLNSNMPEAYLNLASALAHQDKYVEAEADLREAIRLRPNIENAHVDLGYVLSAQGKVTEAEAANREAIRLHPDDAKGYTNLGAALSDQHRYAEAEAAAREALRRQPDSRLVGYKNLVNDLQNQRKYVEAEAAAREAIHLKSDDSSIHYSLGVILVDQGKMADAEAEFREVLRLQPNDSRAHRDLAAAIGKLAEIDGGPRPWDEIAAEYARAVEFAEDGPTSAALRKRLCQELANWDEVFDRVTKLLPNEPTVWLGRGQQRALREKWSEAAADYAKVIRQRSISTESVEYAGLLLLLGDAQSYQQFCQGLVDRPGQPKDAYAGVNLARACALGPANAVDAARMVEWVTQGLQGDISGYRQHVLGLAHYRAGHYDLAIQYIAESNARGWGARTTGQGQNSLVLAMAHHRLSHTDEARQCLEAARQSIEKMRPKPDKLAQINPVDWVAVNVLWREAEALLKESALEPKTNTTDN
jgi:serine/threonine protein kinase/Flp pilus assembly protein TadD